MNIENLRKDMWIAVVNAGKKTVFGEEVEQEFRWKGVPLRVRAISPPFILVAIANEVIIPINISGMELTRLSTEYIVSYFDRRGRKKKLAQQKINNQQCSLEERIYG